MSPPPRSPASTGPRGPSVRRAPPQRPQHGPVALPALRCAHGPARRARQHDDHDSPDCAEARALFEHAGLAFPAIPAPCRQRLGRPTAGCTRRPHRRDAVGDVESYVDEVLSFSRPPIRAPGARWTQLQLVRHPLLPGARRPVHARPGRVGRCSTWASARPRASTRDVRRVRRHRRCRGACPARADPVRPARDRRWLRASTAADGRAPGSDLAGETRGGAARSAPCSTRRWPGSAHPDRDGPG